MKKSTSFWLGCAFVAAGASTAQAEWTDIGKGIYHEGLLTYYGEELGIPDGMVWSVTIEEDSDVKGLYRLAPYSGNNPVAELMSYGDDTYMIIHAEDPEKVWMEDFDFYDDMFCFTHMVPESGWDGPAAGYGTVVDGVITFPAMSLATVDIYDPDMRWHSANRNGEFMIELPGTGSEFEDYSMYLDYKYCWDDNMVPVTITAGESIKSIKWLLQQGTVDADMSTETNADLDEESMALVMAEGAEGTADELTVECTADGIHSLMIVGLDSKGEARVGKIAYVYGDHSVDSEWTSLGTVTYNEDLFAGYYEDLPQAELKAELQENIATPGFYRLVNPYAEYEYNWIEGHEGHNHYIYIHAENPEAVWVENSPIGVDFGDGMGEARVTSTVALAMEAGYTLDEAIEAADEEVGHVTDNVIEFSKWGLWVGQTGWYNGYWTSTGQNFRVELPETSGIDSIAVDKADDSATEYFNLQGVRIDRPATGLYIEKRSGKASKRIAR